MTYQHGAACAAKLTADVSVTMGVAVSGLNHLADLTSHTKLMGGGPPPAKELSGYLIEMNISAAHSLLSQRVGGSSILARLLE